MRRRRPLASNFFRSKPDLNLLVAGTTCLPWDDLEHRVGPTAFHVWRILCASRDNSGITHITRNGIARHREFTRVTERQVKRALVVLHRAGLVTDIGWRRMQVPGRPGQLVERKVFLRRVLGDDSVVRVGGVFTLTLPERPLLMLQKDRNWGGKRAGSGRPRGNQEGARVGVPTEIKRGPPSSSSLSSVVEEASPLSLRERVSATAATAAAVPDLQKKPGEGAVPATLAMSLLPAPPETSTGIGSRFGGGGTKAPSDEILAGKGLPPYPGPALLKPAMVPHPPKLTPEMSQVERARAMAWALRGAVEHRLKVRYWGFGRGSIEKSKHFKTLLAGAKVLMELDVAPAAWAVFSLNVWLEYEGTGRAPPQAWVFSPKRIEERYGWFERDTGNALGGRCVYGDVAQVLLRRYAQARLQAMQSGDVKAAVARWFPDDSYRVLLAKAQAESIEVQRSINARVAHGTWFW